MDIKRLVAWTGIGILGVILIGVIFYFLFAPKAATQSGTQETPGTFPISGSAPVSSTTEAAGQIAIAAQTGDLITKDFIHNGVTTPDPSNAGNYYLTSMSEDRFAIGYSAVGQFFTIALEKEPLGQAREAAENFLLTALGVSQVQLCSLNYYLGTDVHTNSFYAGQHLGFSFCPGAVKLPTK